MKKNIYLTVLMIVTVCCMVFGALYHVAGVFDRGQSATEIDIATVDEPIDGEMVESIRADMDMGSLTVRTGDEFHVSYEGKEKYKPSVTVENGTLAIRQNVGGSISFGFNDNAGDSNLTIVLPKDAVLSNVEVELDFGALELDGVSVQNGTLRTDAGDLNVKNCVLGNMTIDMDTGDLDVQQCDFEMLDIRQDVGDVNISGMQDLEKADIDMRVSLGSLSVNGQDRGTEFVQRGDGGSVLRVTNDVGNIDLNY